MTRKLDITKRVSLAGLAEHWDDECFVRTTAVTYGELKQIKDLSAENVSEEQGVDFILQFVKSHIVGGQARFLDDDGKSKLEALNTDDLDNMTVEMVNHIFESMMNTGTRYADPKAQTPTAISSSPTQNAS